MNYNELQLTQWLLNSRNGDKDSYRHFLTAVLPIINQQVSNKVYNNENIDDVVQDCLEAIHCSLATYDDKRSLMPWLRTIISRRIVDYLRKFYRTMERETLLGNKHVTVEGIDTNKQLEGGFELLNALPEKLMRPLILTKIEGHSTLEAAKLLGIKENALRTRVSRAFVVLQKLAEKELYEI